ncbi:MAG: hypothetical protein DRQ48_00325 [Gammaproteobacteria bacterium]|nr:MAG: hypothetical protein DRQ48_00325 [Gammaproteobacteria bacterium]
MFVGLEVPPLIAQGGLVDGGVGSVPLGLVGVGGPAGGGSGRLGGGRGWAWFVGESAENAVPHRAARGAGVVVAAVTGHPLSAGAEARAH